MQSTTQLSDDLKGTGIVREREGTSLINEIKVEKKQEMSLLDSLEKTLQYNDLDFSSFDYEFVEEEVLEEEE